MTHQHTIKGAHLLENGKHIVICDCGATAERDVLPWNGQVKWSGWFKADSWTSRSNIRETARIGIAVAS